MFCPECKSIMKPQKDGDDVILVCPHCGKRIKPEKSHVLKDPKRTQDKKRFDVADDKNLLAVHDHKCSRCGYDKAQLIEQGVWYTDEDHVVLYKCGKCGHTERDVEKVK